MEINPHFCAQMKLSWHARCNQKKEGYRQKTRGLVSISNEHSGGNIGDDPSGKSVRVKFHHWGVEKYYIRESEIYRPCYPFITYRVTCVLKKDLSRP